MDSRTEPRQQAQRVVDLRRARMPEIEIVACGTYDFLLSLHVAVAAQDYEYSDYDVGREWIEAARARCAAADPAALTVLGRYLGDGHAGSLHGTLISLVALCPEPRDVPHFLDWLNTLPPSEFVEVLLDQDGLDVAWTQLLTTAMSEVRAPSADDAALRQLLGHYPADVNATVETVIRDPEQARSELLAALRVWEEAVFAAERPRILPLLERDAVALERTRAEMPADRFLKLAMRGIEWQRPAGFRRVIFAPSYFSRPAVFYHFWRGTLTFCYPVQAQEDESEARQADPRAPSEETLRFFEALGDSTRLRILRLLAEREMYLTELSERLGLTKATTKHHMIRLRAAGLVTLYDRDRMTYYAIRPDVSHHAAQLLNDYLRRLPHT